MRPLLFALAAALVPAIVRADATLPAPATPAARAAPSAATLFDRLRVGMTRQEVDRVVGRECDEESPPGYLYCSIPLGELDDAVWRLQFEDHCLIRIQMQSMVDDIPNLYWWPGLYKAWEQRKAALVRVARRTRMDLTRRFGPPKQLRIRREKYLGEPNDLLRVEWRGGGEKIRLQLYDGESKEGERTLEIEIVHHKSPYENE